MPKAITIYTTTYCPFCNRVKNLLRSKKIEFTEVELTDNPSLRQKLEKQTGWMTVPMIFMGEEFIGGADDLDALVASGEFDKKMKDGPG